ncbi:MAG: copper chaperone [Pycnora praestabilis]|nr:MAG: copper chaperone [Pycnora praestabilis]
MQSFEAVAPPTASQPCAAVCILETHSSTVSDKVRGLARMVQVSPTLTLVDLTIRGLSPGTYWATVRQTGDISKGAASTGSIWDVPEAQLKGDGSPKGLFGAVEVGKSGIGSVFFDRPIQIWEIIGRSMVISRQCEGALNNEDKNTLVGVIARSAGVWDNDKTVCSCSGKTVWEERKEQVDKGML